MAKEATLEAKEELVNIINSIKTKIKLSNGKTVKVGYIMPEVQDRIDYLIIKYEKFKRSLDHDDIEDIAKGNKATRQFYAKCVAAILLNSFFGLHLFWWIKWRMIYYFGNYNGEDYLKIITEAKKKQRSRSSQWLWHF